jgi:ParB family chromosome partitioning protein
VDVAELSLIENIQREELNPIEESGAYHTLMEMFHLSQEEIARRVGKDRSTIANSLRLLNLPREAQEALTKKEITAGHARTILSVDSPEEQIRVLKEILQRKLSVREAEKLVQGGRTRPQKGKAIKKDPYLLDLEQQISERLMARSSIKPLRSGGVIEIRFTSTDDLNRLSDMLMNVDDH